MGADTSVDLVRQRFLDACMRRQASCQHGLRWERGKLTDPCRECETDEGAAMLSELDALKAERARAWTRQAGQ